MINNKLFGDSNSLAFKGATHTNIDLTKKTVSYRRIMVPIISNDKKIKQSEFNSNNKQSDINK